VKQPSIASGALGRDRRTDAIRVGWLVVAGLAVGGFVASIPAFSREALRALAASPSQDAPTLGFSAEVHVAGMLATALVFALVNWAVGAVIFWRRPDDRLALFVSLWLVVTGAIFPEIMSADAYDHAAWALLVASLEFAWGVAAITLFYVFPDGRFVPRWTRALAVVALVLQGLRTFFPDSPLEPITSSPPFFVLEVAGFIGTMAFAQIYRYRRVSDPAQRQQTKWVVFGLTTALAGYLASTVFQALVPDGNQPGSLSAMVNALGISLAMLLIPLSIGFAVLRYRLWDIDVLINRTLVYGALTGALVAVYFGGVALLQGLVRALVGQDSDVAIVAATLAVAALFLPLRRRIQAFIDRRFFRRKYDATRVLAAHGAALRDDADLEAVGGMLLRAADETMRPAHVSLWLRTPGGGGGHGEGGGG
jgi:hypothetical protein